MIRIRRKCKSIGDNTDQEKGKTPKIKDWGQFILIDSNKFKKDSESLDLTDDNAVIFSYMVMQKYGMTLYDLFEARKGKFSGASIYSLGIQLLDIFE